MHKNIENCLQLVATSHKLVYDNPVQAFKNLKLGVSYLSFMEYILDPLTFDPLIGLSEQALETSIKCFIKLLDEHHVQLVVVFEANSELDTSQLDLISQELVRGINFIKQK